MTCVYLDNNATTQPADAVIDAICEVNTELWANPSSVHRFGQMVRQRLDLARADVAKLIGCRDRELIFTSGGTESNNLALKGVLVRPGSHDNRRRVLITTRMEHAAVREPAGELADALTVAYVPMDSQGRVNPDQFAAVLVEHAHPNSLTLVSVQWVNNETGVIQPVAELVEEFASSQRPVAYDPGRPPGFDGPEYGDGDLGTPGSTPCGDVTRDDPCLYNTDQIS